MIYSDNKYQKRQTMRLIVLFLIVCLCCFDLFPQGKDSLKCYNREQREFLYQTELNYRECLLINTSLENEIKLQLAKSDTLVKIIDIQSSEIAIQDNDIKVLNYAFDKADKNIIESQVKIEKQNKIIKKGAIVSVSIILIQTLIIILL